MLLAAYRLAPLRRLRQFCIHGGRPTDGPRSVARLPPLPMLEVLELDTCVAADGALLAVFQKLLRLAELRLKSVALAPNAEYDMSRYW